ncbi:MAG TPA: ParB/RepB/Spo0J family partition protein [Pirellulaceae bacterium]|nr:ParB/RepB/Spo0J family partition protein [Pirellulaceae bacterium]
MGTTRTTLEQVAGNLEESLGFREIDLRPKLSPVPSARDVGRRVIRNFGKVDINQVIPDPDQPRVEFSEEAIERLAQSIRDKGQLTPIRVRWSAELEKWIIISGERRWRATRQAELPTIDCYFHEGELAKTEILEQQLIENLLREDLSPMEEARAFQSLMDINQWNGKQVADALRVPPSKVSRGLSLLELPPDIQQLVDRGQIAARTAYEISKLPSEDAQRRLAEQAVAGQLSIDDASNAVRKKSGKPKAPPRGTRQVFHADNGWKVTVTAQQKGSYDEIENALRLALDEVQTRIRSGLQLF